MGIWAWTFLKGSPSDSDDQPGLSATREDREEGEEPGGPGRPHRGQGE